MAEDRRASDRRDRERRQGHRRTGGPPLMGEPRTRFTLLYFVVVLAVVLTPNSDRALLERLARLLLENEVVDGAEFRRLMGEPAEQRADRARRELGHAAASSADR